MKLTKVLVAYFEKNYNTLESVSETLKKNRISFRCVKREKLQRKDLRKTDLVITVGGTALSSELRIIFLIPRFLQ